MFEAGCYRKLTKKVLSYSKPSLVNRAAFGEQSQALVTFVHRSDDVSERKKSTHMEVGDEVRDEGKGEN